MSPAERVALFDERGDAVGTTVGGPAVGLFHFLSTRANEVVLGNPPTPDALEAPAGSTAP